MRNIKFSVKDFSLFYGLPGTVIFLISLLVAVKTSQDFGDDTLIRSGVFVGMNALQWFIYLTLFIGVYQEISNRKNVSGFPLKSCVENNHLDGIMSIPFLLENKGVEIISVLTETAVKNTAIPDTQVKGPVQEISFDEIDTTDKPVSCWNASGRTYEDVNEIPHKKVGLLLATSPITPGGAHNFYFENKIKSTEEL